jgi:iron complex outermembrane receptor protein
MRAAMRHTSAVAAIALLAWTAADAATDAAQREVRFLILQQSADKALTAFARQADVSVLFPYDAVSELTANPLIGVYELNEGLQIMLAGTGLDATLDGDEQLTIKIRPQSTASKKDDKPIRTLLSAWRKPFELLQRTGDEAPAPRRIESGAVLEEITVTGSRIRRDDFTSAQPATVVHRDLLDDLAVVNVGDAMAQLPYNLASWSPTSKPGGNDSYPLNVFNGLYLANLRGLNPAYGSRTLTLIDSRRHVPTNQGDGVDLNVIPSILVERMEVVTGGASASYGSGAIGGVVNVLLDRGLDGARAQLDMATTGAGDGDDIHYGFAWGGAIGDRGRLLVGLEVQKLDEIADCIDVRDWCARGAQIQVNRNYAVNADPNYVYRENVRVDMGTTGVLPALGLMFDETGTALVPYEPADPYGVGGDGQHVYLDTSLRSNVDRRVTYASYEHRFASGLGLLVDVSSARVEAFTPQDSIDLFAAPIAPDNFFLAKLGANPCAAAPGDCRINKDFSAEANSANDTRAELERVMLGFDGRLGESAWTWDAYYQHGRSKMLQAVYDSRHADRMLFALDAVDDGNGNPVCRVTRDGIYPDYDGDPRLAEDCVPINIFGIGNITPDAFAYTFGRILETTEVKQDMLELIASGPVRPLEWSGVPVRAAIGVSWRNESLDNIADPTQPDHIRTDYNSQYGETFGGKVEVIEYFGELDIPATDTLNLQIAARRSSYVNTAGIGTGISGATFRYDIDAWKVNGSWDATPWLRVRASQSRDIRAPNFRELYYRKVFPRGSNFGYCDNPWTGNRFLGYYTHTGDPCVVELLGGHDLTPEEADTTTIGVVLMPETMKFRLAVDYFDIGISDAISPANLQLTMDGCYLARDPYFCGQIEGTLLDPDDPLGGFSRIEKASPEALNLRAYESRGIDISADWHATYRFGTLSSRLMATRTIEQLVQPSSRTPQLIDISGVTGSPGAAADWEPAPDWAAQWITTYRRGAVGMTAHARYVSAGKKFATRVGPQDPGYDPNAEDSIDDNRVPGYIVWSLGASYDFGSADRRAELFGMIHNVFDKEPPLIGNGLAGTNPVLFDTIGRNFRLGLRVEF